MAARPLRTGMLKGCSLNFTGIREENGQKDPVDFCGTISPPEVRCVKQQKRISWGKETFFGMLKSWMPKLKKRVRQIENKRGRRTDGGKAGRMVGTIKESK